MAHMRIFLNSLMKKWIKLHVCALQVIADYTTPPSKEMSRDLESRLKPYIRYLTHQLYFQVMIQPHIPCFLVLFLPCP